MFPSGLTQLLSVAAYEVELLNSTQKNVFDYYEAKIHRILKASKYQNVWLLLFTCRKTRLINVSQYEPCRCLLLL